MCNIINVMYKYIFMVFFLVSCMSIMACMACHVYAYKHIKPCLTMCLQDIDLSSMSSLNVLYYVYVIKLWLNRYVSKLSSLPTLPAFYALLNEISL